MLVFKICKNTWGCGSMVEGLPTMCKALGGLIPRNCKKKRRKEKEK
jgi:hypothetical protein